MILVSVTYFLAAPSRCCFFILLQQQKQIKTDKNGIFRKNKNKNQLFTSKYLYMSKNIRTFAV